MFFSIIISVYHIEEYLQECLDSLIKCMNEHCEMILVVSKEDDQASKSICQKYSETSENIRTITQSTQSLSNARNCGLRESCGTYVLFLDGDDFVDSHLFRKQLQIIEKSNCEMDLIIADFDFVNIQGESVKNIRQLKKCKTLSSNEKNLKRLFNYQCFWNVWHCIYKRNFLINHNFLFTENIFAEDLDFALRILLVNPKIYYIHNPYYKYRVGRSNSLMNQNSCKKTEDLVSIIEEQILILENTSIRYKKLLIKNLRYEYFLNISQISEISFEEKDTMLHIFSKWKTVVCSVYDLFACLVTCFISIFGISNLSSLLLQLKKVKRRLRDKNDYDKNTISH